MFEKEVLKVFQPVKAKVTGGLINLREVFRSLYPPNNVLLRRSIKKDCKIDGTYT